MTSTDQCVGPLKAGTHDASDHQVQVDAFPSAGLACVRIDHGQLMPVSCSAVSRAAAGARPWRRRFSNAPV